MNSAGRKPKYPTELLQEELTKYIKVYPNTTIKFSKLEQYTGIPRHIWRDNSKINELICSLNNPKILVDTTNLNFQLPSANEILDKNYPNKEKLLSAITDLIHLSSSLYDKAIIGEKFEKTEIEYKVKIAELEAKYRILKQESETEIKKLNHEIDCLYLDSRNSLIRKQKGLKDNMIDISKAREKSLSKNLKDIEDEFSGLFD